MRAKFTVSLDELVRAFLASHNLTLNMTRVYGIDISASSIPDSPTKSSYVSTTNFATFEVETK